MKQNRLKLFEINQKLNIAVNCFIDKVINLALFLSFQLFLYIFLASVLGLWPTNPSDPSGWPSEPSSWPSEPFDRPVDGQMDGWMHG